MNAAAEGSPIADTIAVLGHSYRFDPGSGRVYVVAASTVNVYQMNAAGALAPLADLACGFTPPAGTTAAPNSVAIANGIVAVAYEIEVTASGAQQPGRVGFFEAASGAFLNSVEVGHLPDMLTFAADGTKVLVANEGEPNSYGQANSFDPEGSVSIIDLAGGVASAKPANWSAEGAVVRPFSSSSAPSKLVPLPAPLTYR